MIPAHIMAQLAQLPLTGSLIETIAGMLRAVEDATRGEGLPKGAKGVKKAKERTRFAVDAQPDQCDREAAVDAGMSMEEFRFEWKRFRDHHLQVGSLMADWAAAWRTWASNWVRFTARDQQRQGMARRGVFGKGPSTAEVFGDIAAEMRLRNGARSTESDLFAGEGIGPEITITANPH